MVLVLSRIFGVTDTLSGHFGIDQVPRENLLILVLLSLGQAKFSKMAKQTIWS